LNEKNILKAINVFKTLNFKPRIPEPFEALLDKNKREQWINKKNALVYTILSEKGDIQIDIFLVYEIDYETLKNNSDTFVIDDREVNISSKKDLIKAKKSVNPVRDKDLYDIKQLEEILKNENK